MLVLGARDINALALYIASSLFIYYFKNKVYNLNITSVTDLAKGAHEELLLEDAIYYEELS